MDVSIEKGFFSKVPILKQFNLRLLIAMENGEHATLTGLLFALFVGQIVSAGLAAKYTGEFSLAHWFWYAW